MRRGVVLVLAAGARVAHAEPKPVDVTVTEIAGDLAFVTPGGAAGLRAGDAVQLGDRTLVVVEVTTSAAAVRIEAAGSAAGSAAGLDIGAKGIAHASGDTPLPPVAAPGAFRAQWPDAKPPAADQHPAEVKLDSARAAARRTQLVVETTTAGTLSSSGATGELDGRVATSFMAARSIGVDADVTGRLFSDGWNSHERTPLLVNAAELRFGNAASPWLVGGRLPYAATGVGLLDGARVELRTGDVTVAAFGGEVPDAISGHVDTRGERFGIEGIIDDPTGSWQPRVAVDVHASTWNGDLDERRLSLAASAHHDATSLDGWAELELFPANNPWNAPAAQITGAGATVEWRGDGGTHAGLDATFLRPERSLRLDAELPPTWACTRAALPGNVAEACLDIEWWAEATASAGLRRGAWSIDAVGTLGDSHGQTTFVDGSGYVRGELRLGMPRVFAAVSAGDAGFVAWQAVEAGVGITAGRVDADVAYRPERLDYQATTGGALEQQLVANARVTVSRAVAAELSALGSFGGDADVVAIIATLVWHPLK